MRKAGWNVENTSYYEEFNESGFPSGSDEVFIKLQQSSPHGGKIQPIKVLASDAPRGSLGLRYSPGATAEFAAPET